MTIGPPKKKNSSRSQHFVLESRDIESVTRREGRWGFSKVCMYLRRKSTLMGVPNLLQICRWTANRGVASHARADSIDAVAGRGGEAHGRRRGASPASAGYPQNTPVFWADFADFATKKALRLALISVRQLVSRTTF